MSTIAEQIKSFYTLDQYNEMMEECESKGEATQDWENETTEFDFPDGSVLIVCNDNISAYGSR